MRTIQSIIIIFCASVGLSLAGCSGPPPEKAAPVRPVKIHTIGSLEPEAMREFPGTIRANQTAEMGFEVEGLVTKFFVKEGDIVKEDAVLAKLDPARYQAELDATEAKLKEAEQRLARSEKIREENPGAVTKEQIETDKKAVEVAKSDRDIRQKDLDDTELKAPFAGVMARKLVEDFANVLKKEPVLILLDNSNLEIEVAVPERAFVRGNSGTENLEELTKRLKPVVIVSSLPDREFPAEFYERALIADPVTRTFPVKLSFDNPADVNILPGMTARVRVVIDPQSAWSVPATAAQADENEQPYVWKVDSEKMTVSKAPVELDDLAGDRVRLISGVEEGDMVAISGVTALREGMQVRKYEN